MKLFSDYVALVTVLTKMMAKVKKKSAMAQSWSVVILFYLNGIIE